jgi:ORF6N domain
MPTRPAAQNLISTATIERQILVLRGHRVMLDRDLAAIYGVKLKRLNEQVKRNRGRFPDDFMFQLTLEEGKLVILSRSQIATLKRGAKGDRRNYGLVNASVP